MKRLLFVFTFLLYSIFSFGQLTFEWFNKDLRVLERINFQNENYEVHKINKENSFKIKKKLRFEGVILSDILPNYDLNVFPKGKIRILTVPGTGQVYELDLNKSQFKRIDKTFYRGYNFKALQFIENDTLFSLGGTGFWQYHNVLTYFDPTSSEWQVMYPKGDRPEGIYLNSSGISDSKVFAIEKLRDLDKKDPKKNAQIFEFDIKSKTWSTYGELNIPLLSEFEINSPEFQWSSNHLFFLHAKEPIYADVKNNKVYKYNESRRSIITNKGMIFISEGWVYTYRNEHNKFLLDSIPYAELQRNSILLGDLYSKTPKTLSQSKFYILGFFVILTVGSIFLYRINLKSKRTKVVLLNKTPPKYFDKMLESYKVNGLNHLLSTDELTKIIECDSMAFDTQRQYRSKFISSINTYTLDNYGISDAFYRLNHESDKRFIQYGIKKELFALIEDILV